MRDLTALAGVVELASPGAAPLGPAGATRTAWGGESATVEIVAPDRFCAQVFVNLVGSLFPFELVGTGTSWVIRLRPLRESAWEGRLLLLVQRWLESCPLPCATIEYGGRRYVFRSALTHTAIWSGFDVPHGLEPLCEARAASPRGASWQPQLGLVTER